MIVGRLHVGTPLPEVCRYVLSRTKAGVVKRIRREPRGSDHRNRLAGVLREARKIHRENRAEYRQVMGGTK